MDLNHFRPFLLDPSKLNRIVNCLEISPLLFLLPVIVLFLICPANLVECSRVLRAPPENLIFVSLLPERRRHNVSHDLVFPFLLITQLHALRQVRQSLRSRHFLEAGGR